MLGQLMVSVIETPIVIMIYVCFLHDRPWISPWMKPIYNELDITIHVIASQLPCDCGVISNRMWRYLQNEDRASETREWCVKIVVFVIIYGSVISCKKLDDVCTLVKKCFCAHSSVIYAFIKHKNNPLVSAETVRHTNTYTIIYLYGFIGKKHMRKMSLIRHIFQQYYFLISK